MMLDLGIGPRQVIDTRVHLDHLAANFHMPNPTAKGSALVMPRSTSAVASSTTSKPGRRATSGTSSIGGIDLNRVSQAAKSSKNFLLVLPPAARSQIHRPGPQLPSQPRPRKANQLAWTSRIGVIQSPIHEPGVPNCPELSQRIPVPVACLTETRPTPSRRQHSE